MWNLIYGAYEKNRGDSNSEADSTRQMPGIRQCIFESFINVLWDAGWDAFSNIGTSHHFSIIWTSIRSDFAKAAISEHFWDWTVYNEKILASEDLPHVSPSIPSDLTIHGTKMSGILSTRRWWEKMKKPHFLVLKWVISSFSNQGWPSDL